MYDDSVPDKTVKGHGENMMWSMTYPNPKTKAWIQSYMVNVPRRSYRQAKNITWRQSVVVHDLYKDKNMATKLCGKCTTTQFPTRQSQDMERIICGPRYI